MDLFSWIEKAIFKETNFRRFANKPQNSKKLMHTEVNFAKTNLQEKSFPQGNKRNPSGQTT